MSTIDILFFQLFRSGHLRPSCEIFNRLDCLWFYLSVHVCHFHNKYSSSVENYHSFQKFFKGPSNKGSMKKNILKPKPNQQQKQNKQKQNQEQPKTKINPILKLIKPSRPRGEGAKSACTVFNHSFNCLVGTFFMVFSYLLFLVWSPGHFATKLWFVS